MPSHPDCRVPVAVDWYRTPISLDLFKRLHQRSDWLGFRQTLGFLGVAALLAGATIWAQRHGHWFWALAGLFGYGTVAHFYVNAMHELTHGTVFRTKFWNGFFARLISFLGWLHPDHFNASHQRHHRYTLHPPDDLEVRLPTHFSLYVFLVHLVVNPPFFRWMVCNTTNFALGRFEGEWNLICVPEAQSELRRDIIRWARVVLGGHLAILVISVWSGWWMIPVVVSFGPFVGGWLWFLCNNSQHTGMQDNVSDFRLCCRTVVPHPIVRFLYWHMNYHVEHHMYAAVPCYHLKRLHEAIRHDLPPCQGLRGAWREIRDVQRRQQEQPDYVPTISLPPPSRVGGSA